MILQHERIPKEYRELIDTEDKGDQIMIYLVYQRHAYKKEICSKMKQMKISIRGLKVTVWGMGDYILTQKIPDLL